MEEERPTTVTYIVVSEEYFERRRGRETLVPRHQLVTLAALACLVFFYLQALPNIEFGCWAMNVGVGPDGALVELP